MNLRELQAEVGKWAEDNFAPIQWHWPLLGMIEEVGEICNAAQTDEQAVLQMSRLVGAMAHLHLKEEQGIRHQLFGHALQDSYADELCRILNWYKSGSHQGGPEPVDDEGQIQDGLADLLIFMLCWCHRMGWDLQEIVDLTWPKVRGRNWRKFPQNGVDA